MTPAQRREVVMGAEGNMLSNCSRLSADDVSDYARCYIDGAANALIRMQGAEVAARFIFALGDRVAGGLRAQTDWREPPAIEAIKPPPVPVLPAPEPVPLKTDWHLRAHDYVWGVIHGLVAAGIIYVVNR